MNTTPVLTAVYAYPENGYAPATNLEIGKEYVVASVSSGAWITYIWLENVEGAFNSVQFDFFEDGKPISIFSSARYNSFAF